MDRQSVCWRVNSDIRYWECENKHDSWPSSQFNCDSLWGRDKVCKLIFLLVNELKQTSRRSSVWLSVCLYPVLAKLIWDLQSFLSVLDSENLSYIAQAQKKSISELLSTLQNQDAPGKNTPVLTLLLILRVLPNPDTRIKVFPAVFSVEDAEYMIMSCPSSSPSNELTDTPAKGTP